MLDGAYRLFDDWQCDDEGSRVLQVCILEDDARLRYDRVGRLGFSIWAAVSSLGVRPVLSLEVRVFIWLLVVGAFCVVQIRIRTGVLMRNSEFGTKRQFGE